MKKLSFVFIILGVCFIGYASWQMVNSNLQTSQSLKRARSLVRDSSDQPEYLISEKYKSPIGEAVRILDIPRLNAELPIVEGTDPDDLEKGVGHYKGSFYPNENGQIVLSGHRDTVFR